LIYELQNSDILTSITVGLFEYPSAANSDIVLAVYHVNDNMELGEMIFEEQYPRTAGNNNTPVVFDVPDTKLEPGKYFFEVRQLDGQNIGVVFDDDWEVGYFYIHIPEEEYFEAESGFGYIHLRPNFGINGVGISPKQISDNQLLIYPNPTDGKFNVSGFDVLGSGVSIYDLTGRKCYETRLVTLNSEHGTVVDVSHLPAGLYFVEVNGIRGKFVKK
jgi:hypothetical protein